jgi:aryl-alcohol dehydrogenase-like predicted oxidoreductase
VRRTKLGRTRLEVPVISQGTWQMGADEWGAIDDAAAVETIRTAIDAGINLIDTAPRYGVGHAEELVGKAVKGLRSKVLISTKCGLFTWKAHDGTLKTGKDLTAKAIRGEIEASLARIGTDYLDLYTIHWPDPVTPLEESLFELERLRKEGKFRYLGLSNFSLGLLQRAMKAATIDCLQTQFSLLSRENSDLIGYAAEHGIGVFAYGTLGGGILSGRTREVPTFKGKDARDFFYPFFKQPLFDRCLALVDELQKIAERRGTPVAHVAINWTAQQEGIASALVGSVSPNHAAENALAGDWTLSPEEITQIDAAFARTIAAGR